MSIPPKELTIKQAHFHPCGDGYPIACESSGGSVSIAAYDWIDLALCTDSIPFIYLACTYFPTHSRQPARGLASLRSTQASLGFVPAPELSQANVWQMYWWLLVILPGLEGMS